MVHNYNIMKVNSEKDVADEYTSSLADLTINSKPLINMLTILAEDYIDHAPVIVKVVELHLQKVQCDIKLPVLYLIDSIVKNVGKTYVQLFTQNIVSTFCSVFEKVDEKVRSQLFKLRQTWNDVFPTKKLFALDIRVNAMDPAWPITASPPQQTSLSSSLADTMPSDISDGVMREELLKQQKELLELQKRKVELQLMQTKAILEEQQKKLENQTSNFINESSQSNHSNNLVSSNQRISSHQQNEPSQNQVNKLSSDIFSNRDPRKRLHDKNNECGRKKNVAMYSDNKESIQKIKGQKIERKIIKKRNYYNIRFNNITTSQINVPSWSSKDNTLKETSIISPTCFNPYDKNLLTKLPAEEPPPPGVDVVICAEATHHTEEESEVSRDNSDSNQNNTSAISLVSSSDTNNSSIETDCAKETSYGSEDKTDFLIKANKRLNSSTPSSLSTDSDLQAQSEIEEPPIKKTTDIQFSPKQSFALSKDSIVSPSMDVDLRLLPSTKLITEDAQESSVKVSSEIIDTLFGEEDVDLRKFPSMVGSPPQTVTSSSQFTTSFCDEAVLTKSSSSTDVATLTAETPTSTISDSHTFLAKREFNNDTFHSQNIISFSSQKNKSESSSITVSSSADSPYNLPSPLRSVVNIPKKSAGVIDTKSIAISNSFKQSTPLSCKTPSPPPPPIISKDDASEENSWANYKRTKSEEGFIVSANFQKNKSILRSSNFIFRNSEVIEEKETDQESQERSKENCNLIIKEAELQLSTGNITFSQYNRMLKEVIAINEERKIQEALKKDNSYIVQALEMETEVVEKPKDENIITNLDHQNLKEMEEALTSDVLDKSDNMENFNEESIFIDKENQDLLHGQTHQSLKIDNKNKRVFYSTEMSKKSSPCNIAYKDRMGSSHQLIWDNRKYHAKTYAQMGGTHRPWYPRGTRVQQMACSSLITSCGSQPKCNSQNFQFWMGTSTVTRILNPPHYYEPSNSSVFRYGGQGSRKKIFTPAPCQQRRTDVPPADPHVLEIIEKDCVRSIMIDDVVREIRYYGETGVTFMGWDDPREVTFQSGTRGLVVDDRDQFLLHFNAPYRECIIDGHLFRIRLGGPTRELFIDGLYFETVFGGPAIQIFLAGCPRKLQLSGPTPQVRIGDIRRTDLVAGKINLIVDAKRMFPIFLDAKPQKFEVEGVPYILRFVEALQTVVINGIPFKFEYGGAAVSIFLHGEKHFLRLSVLPQGVRPGYISIINMEGGRLPSPEPEYNVVQPIMNSGNHINKKVINYNIYENEHPLELLTSLMPTTIVPLPVHSYTLEHLPISSVPLSGVQTICNINVSELFQKLVASGIVPPVEQKENLSTETDNISIKVVDFSKPETLKVKQPRLIAQLYSGIQCSSCGVRFPPEHTVKYSQHLDWHFRQNRREKVASRLARSRRWNYDVSDWIQFQEIEDMDDRTASWFELQEKNRIKEQQGSEPSTVAGDITEEAVCRVCHDEFDQFYNEDKEEWHLKRAIRVNGELFHPLCYEDLLENRARIESPEPYNFHEDEPEPIIIDDCDSDVTNFNDKLEENNTNEQLKFQKSEDNARIDASFTLIPEEKEELSLIEDKDYQCPSKQGSESDDDILQIEVVERPIESYEIPDDDDEEEDCNKDIQSSHITLSSPLNNPTSTSYDIYNFLDETPIVDEEEMDFTSVKVKTEKSDITHSDYIITSNYKTVVSTIDGNVELDEATPILIPNNKIKINITSKCTTSSRSIPENITDSTPSMEPPPPGEELVPANIKPKLVGIKMEITDKVVKGTDSSALCCLM